jgi:hypothetical protein
MTEDIDSFKHYNFVHHCIVITRQTVLKVGGGIILFCRRRKEEGKGR